jgi:hypothetical protein
VDIMRLRFTDDIDAAALVEFARAWSKMGWAVAEQVEAILDDADAWSEQNPNALRVAQERIGGFHPEIDGALAEALKKFDDETEPFCDACQQHRPCSCDDMDPMEANERLKDYE